MSVVPSSLVVKRWSKDAKKECHVQSVHPELQNEELHAMVRSGNLNGSFGKLCRYASKTEEGYKLVKQEIERLSVLAEEIWRKNGGLEPMEKTAERTPSIRIKVPHVVKTKGRKSESSTQPTKRRCSHCTNEGHDVRTCPQKDHGDTGAHASTS
ncbi:unnamed protein product [Linum trigynum]|uniref:CCHC-type domain-containing protein n=1 Tax=Linum trigynum TaxID=586398 RepID=A0AAV2DZZ5_9ROSI